MLILIEDHTPDLSMSLPSTKALSTIMQTGPHSLDIYAQVYN